MKNAHISFFVTHHGERNLPACVAVLRAERRAEGVHAGQGASVVLHLRSDLTCVRNVSDEVPYCVRKVNLTNPRVQVPGLEVQLLLMS